MGGAAHIFFGEMDLERMLTPVVENAGMELVDLTFRREGAGKVLRVTIDRDGGIDLAAISLVSERVSRRLDLEGFDPGPYSLEVSSPGVERPLKRPEHFAKRVGERAKVKTHDLLEGAKVHEGPIVEATSDAVTIATDAGERRIEYGQIASARTVFVWGAEGGRRRR